jgi:hypothetical protein
MALISNIYASSITNRPHRLPSSRLNPNVEHAQGSIYKDIPPVTLTNIPHVDSAAFKPYLTQVGSLYDAFQRAKGK